MAKFKVNEAERLHDVRALIRRSGTLYGWRTGFKQFGPKHRIQEFTYRDLLVGMEGLGTALWNMGLQGKHIALLGENSFEWVQGYVTILGGLGVAVPLDKELPAEDVARLINRSDTEGLFLSRKFLKHIPVLRERCPQLQMIMILNPESEDDIPEGCYSGPQLIQKGCVQLAQGDRRYVDAYIDDGAMSEILFTSGTTGANKGVMLSNKNITAVVYSARKHIEPGKVLLSVLPINHSYECSTTVLTGIYAGSTICFNDSLKHVVMNIKLFKPDQMIVVPMFLESIMRNIWNEARKSGLEQHMRYGVRFSNLIRRIGIDKRRYFFKPVLDGLGGNLTTIVCGGAPLRGELIRQFGDLGITVINGYGITECAPLVASNSTSWQRSGSVGRVVPVCEVRIGSKGADGIGEVEIKGENVMLGYYKDPESTQRSFTEDGWFRTGDLGSIDKDNFLYLSGREKNLIILPNGKNVSPEEIEEIVSAKLPYAEEVLVYASRDANGQQDQILCAVYPQSEWYAAHTPEEAQKILQDDIRRINHSMAAYKQIADAVLTDREFEKTTTRKIKRHIAERRFTHA